MFYNYVLQSKKSGELYKGLTNNLKRRLVEHNLGLNLSTKKDKPWRIIYCEVCLSEKDAKRREKYLKTTHGRRMLRYRIKEFLSDQRSKDLTNRNSTTG